MKDKFYYPGIQCSIEVDGAIYFPSFYGDILCKLENNKIDIIGKLSTDKKSVSISSISGIEVYKGKLYLIPHLSDSLIIYDLNTKDFSKINIDNPSSVKAMFFDHIIDGNMLWMFPTRYPGIVCVNLDTYELTKYDDWVSEVNAVIGEKEFRFAKKGVVKQGNKIFISLSTVGVILEFNIIDHTSNIHKISDCGFNYACVKDDNIWLFPSSGGSVFKWHPSTDEVKEYPQILDEVEAPDIVGTIELPGGIIMFPHRGGSVIKFDFSSASTYKLDEFNCFYDEISDLYSLWDLPVISILRGFGNYPVVCGGKNRKLFQYNYEDHTIKELDVGLTEGCRKEFDYISNMIMSSNMKNIELSGLIDENAQIGLRELLGKVRVNE